MGGQIAGIRVTTAAVRTRSAIQVLLFCLIGAGCGQSGDTIAGRAGDSEDSSDVRAIIAPEVDKSGPIAETAAEDSDERFKRDCASLDLLTVCRFDELLKDVCGNCHVDSSYCGTLHRGRMGQRLHNDSRSYLTWSIRSASGEAVFTLRISPTRTDDAQGSVVVNQRTIYVTAENVPLDDCQPAMHFLTVRDFLSDLMGSGVDAGKRM